MNARRRTHDITASARRQCAQALELIDAEAAFDRTPIAFAPYLVSCSDIGVLTMPVLIVHQSFELALRHHQAGRLTDAEVLYRQILAVEPNHAEALHHLGIIAQQTSRCLLAVELIRQAIVLNPSVSAAYCNLGEAYRSAGQLSEAIAACRRAIELKPDLAEAYNNLGNALRDQRHFDKAVAAFRHALQLKPDHATTHYNLGNALRDQGRIDEAIATYCRALQLKPDYLKAHHNLGNALFDQGRLDDAIASYRRALQINPDDCETHSNLIYTLHLRSNSDHRATTEEQLRWNQRFSEPAKRSILPHVNNREPARRLRIGYVSPDFCSHPVSYFIAPLLEAHDHDQFEIYCYADVLAPDAVTQRLQNGAHVWRNVYTLSHSQLAEQVRDDGIDILVDLAMHTGGNRLPTFAYRPAPVQVSWLAYPGSAGLETIHYRLTDAYIDPIGQEGNAGFGEQVVRLPNSWCCYAPNAEFPPVGPLPAANTNSVTFGSLNRFSKINEALLCCWAKLLRAVPGSRLFMICPEGQARERAHSMLTAQGVARERVGFAASSSWPDYIQFFEGLDLALDAFPCNGMTTTCHSLWMGVPVVTRTGTSPVSRAGSSLLHTTGLPELVAGSEEDYVRIAAELARNLPRLAELRATLRPRMAASPLMDAPLFARNIETAYRAMWREWCAMRQP